MEYRQLGGSGLRLGADDGHDDLRRQGQLRKGRQRSLEEVRRLIDLVADAGVNLIDTAERLFGRPF